MTKKSEEGRATMSKGRSTPQLKATVPQGVFELPPGAEEFIKTGKVEKEVQAEPQPAQEPAEESKTQPPAAESQVARAEEGAKKIEPPQEEGRAVESFKPAEPASAIILPAPKSDCTDDEEEAFYHVYISPSDEENFRRYKGQRKSWIVKASTFERLRAACRGAGIAQVDAVNQALKAVCKQIELKFNDGYLFEPAPPPDKGGSRDEEDKIKIFD
jgi:hypothetical protein